MNNQADFTLRLINQISGPAKAAKGSIADLKAGLKQTGKSASKTSSDVDKHYRQQRAALDKVAKAQDALHLRASRRRAQEQRQQARLQAMFKRTEMQYAARQAKLKAAEEKRRMAQSPFAALDKLGKVGLIAGGIGLAVAAMGKLVGLIGEAIAAVGRLGMAFVQTAYESAKFAQASVKSIGYLTGSATVGAREFDKVREQAQTLGLDVEKTTGSFKKLLAAQFDLGKAHELIAMSADLKAVAGLSDDDVGGVLLAITQIKSKGRLMAQEMLQLQERGVSSELVYAALGKRLNKTTDELRKLQESGKITSDLALDAIIEAVQKKTGTSKTGQAGEDFANTTLQGLENKLKAAWDNLWIDLGLRTEKGLTIVAQKIRGTLGKITESPAFQNLADGWANRFDRLIVWTEQNWPRIEQKVLPTIDKISTNLDKVGRVIDHVTRNWDQYRLVLEGASILAKPFVWVFKKTTSAALLATAAIAGVTAGISYLVGWVSSTASNAYTAATTWVTNLANGLVDGFYAQIERVKAAAGMMAQAIQDKVRSVLDMHSPSRVMAELGVQTAMGFQIGIERQTPAVEGASVGLSRATLAGAVNNSSSSSSSIGALHVHVEAPANEQNPEEWGAKVGVGLRRELQSLFEQMELEGV